LNSPGESAATRMAYRSEDARLQLFSADAALIRDLAVRTSGTVLDDLHWADDASI
jgi:predicted ATPase